MVAPTEESDYQTEKVTSIYDTILIRIGITIQNQLNRNVEILITPSNEDGGHLRVVAT